MSNILAEWGREDGLSGKAKAIIGPEPNSNRALVKGKLVDEKQAAGLHPPW